MIKSARELATMSGTPLRDEHSECLTLGQVANEVNVCLKQGRDPDVDELATRHPELAAQIRELVPALVALHELGHGDLQERVPSVSVPALTESGVAGRLGDYRIVREIGRGGMGVVYEAEQISLGRRVALKVLPFAAVLDPRRLQRFKNEAHAAGQLHHQHIVPVYSVGLERGVHYYAMQYIEGQSLADVIDQLRRHAEFEKGPSDRLRQAHESESEVVAAGAPESPRSLTAAALDVASALASGQFAPAERGPTALGRTAHGPTGAFDEPAAGHDRREPTPLNAADTKDHAAAGLSTERSCRSRAYFRSVAKSAVQAAEALEHAHGIGVLHRDVKPSNLLLDTHGNLWITDFGLARMEGEAGLTMSGDLLGTLRYMSPEQALAKRVSVDHRTDIYSLGVTLYELLTLHPAVEGRDRQEILRRIAFEEPPLPRRLNSAIPSELETIVLKAMAKNPAERYASAQELADDLNRFLEDRPIRAKRPNVLQRFGKWTRRHKIMVRTMLVTLLLALAVGAAAVWQQRSEAMRQRDLATANYRRTRELLDTFVNNLSAEPRLRAHGLESLRQDLLLRAKAVYEELLEERGDDPDVRAEHAETLRRLGLITAELGDTTTAINLYRQAQVVYQQMARAHPDGSEYELDLARTQHDLGTLFLTTRQYGAAETAYHEALVIFQTLAGASPHEPKYLAHAAQTHNSLGALFRNVAQHDKAESAYREALAIQQVLAEHYPNNPAYQQQLARIYSNIGELCNAIGRPQEAETALEKAMSVFEPTAQGDPSCESDLAKCHRNLGDLFRDTGRPALAEAAIQKAMAICNRLARTHSDVPEFDAEHARCYHSLAYVNWTIGRADEAESNCAKALEIWEKLIRVHPENPDYLAGLAASNNTLGVVCKHTGRTNQAEAAFNKVLSIRRQLAEANPGSVEYECDLAKAHHNLAELYSAANRMKEAEISYQHALGIWEKLLGDHPRRPNFRDALAKTLSSLGLVYEATRRRNDAEAAYQRALEIDQKLTEEFPEASTYQDDLADTLSSLGILYRATARLEQAETAYRRALAIEQKLTQEQPDVLEFASSHGAVCCNMGNLIQDRGQAEESLDWYAKAITSLQSVLEREPRHTEARQFIRNSLLARAWALTTLSRHRDALADWDAALQLVTGPFRDHVRSVRAVALAHLGQHAQATAEADELSKETGVQADVLYNAACAFSLSSTAASQDDTLDTVDQGRLAEQYAARALELLRHAQVVGYFRTQPRVDHVKSDTDLDPLRTREDFRKLLRELQGD